MSLTRRTHPAPPAAKPVQVILASVSALPFASAGRGAGLVIVELGAAAFFAAGVADRAVGDTAPWFLLVAVLIGFAVRAVDLESCALLIPGGFYSAAQDALGRPAARLAASALLIDRVLFAALAAASAGHYAAVVVRPFLTAAALERQVTVEDLATTIAAALIGVVWWRQRQGRALSNRFVNRTVGGAVAVLSRGRRLGRWHRHLARRKPRACGRAAVLPDAGMDARCACVVGDWLLPLRGGQRRRAASGGARVSSAEDSRPAARRAPRQRVLGRHHGRDGLPLSRAGAARKAWPSGTARPEWRSRSTCPRRRGRGH